MAQQKSSPIWLILIGSILLVVGLGVGLWIGKPILDEAKASASWPKVKGNIINSSVGTHRGNKGKITYSADVNYTYNPDGKSERTGTRVWIGQYTSSSRTSMQNVVNQFPAGSEVDVFYSPQAPDHSVLQPGAFFSSYMVFGIGIIMAVIGGILIANPIFMFILGIFMFSSSSQDDFSGNNNYSNDTYTIDDDRHSRDLS